MIRNVIFILYLYFFLGHSVVSCHCDLDAMTLIYDLDLQILKTHPHSVDVCEESDFELSLLDQLRQATHIPCPYNPTLSLPRNTQINLIESS